MGMQDCFPDWLRRRNNQRFGPNFEDAIPYPVYQQQPSVLSDQNPNTYAALISDSFYQGHADIIAGAAAPTTVIQVCPNNVYDSIDIVALDGAAIGAGVVIPIFLSMDRPGRITTTTPARNGSQEVNACVVDSFAGHILPANFDPSALPNVISAGTAGSTKYSCLHYPTARTNRPFYVWFNDGLTTLPTNVLYKISWVTMGR